MANKVICIGRQYGSDGRAIGKRLAELVGVQCYDSRLIDLAAAKAGVDPDRLRGVDEQAVNPWLYTMPGDRMADAVGYFRPMNDTLFALQSDVIKQLADSESCVIVGRCADYVLSGIDWVKTAFIYADFQTRVSRVMERHGISQKEATSVVKRMDKQRAAYYVFYTDKGWGKPESADIMLNSGTLGTENCAHILAELYNKM